MIRNTFFCMPRFVNLCRKNMVESWRTNILRWVMMYGVMAIILLWNAYFSYTHKTELSHDKNVWQFGLIFFAWSLFAFGCLSASFTMDKMKTKTGRLAELMVPVTPFEKYFSRWIISTVVFLIVFLLAFRLADYTRVLVYTIAYPDFKVIAPVPFSQLIGQGENNYTLVRTVQQFYTLIAVYFFFQSCFVLGSSIWPKNAFLKTFASGVIIVISYTLLILFLNDMLQIENRYYSFDSRLTQEVGLTILCISSWLFALLNWVLAYFRFKESEIINRM